MDTLPDAPAGGNARLSEAHRAELAASGITPEAAAAAGVYTETDTDLIADLLNWDGRARGLGPCLVYPYFDASGQPTRYHRLKPTAPRTSKRQEDTGKPIKYEGPKGKPNRLYIPPGTRAAVADPAVPLVLTEGEKKALAADAAGFPCLSVPGVWAWQKRRPKGADGRGTGRRELIDDLAAVAWTGRRVYVAFDSDGDTNPLVLAAERELAKALAAAGAVVVVARLPPGPDGGKQGLDDYLVRHGADALDRLLAAAASPPPPPPGGGSAGGGEAGREGEGEGRKPNPADVLVDLALAECELWHDPALVGYATAGRRSMAVRGRAFRLWLIARYRAENEGRVPNADALGNAVNAVDAEAVIDGPEHEAHVRVAAHDGRVYLHLADGDDTVVAVGPDGWRECPDPPVRFRRAAGALALPTPEPGGSLADLRALLNLEDGDQFALIVGFLCGALSPGGPQPALVANGEQGSGKTTVARAVKALVDPSAAPVRSEPKEVRDLMIAARNNHVLALDNLSHLPGWLSDALCRLATGGGFATRELYTNDDEVIFDARRPTVLNGIEEFVTRGDLLERSILLRLPAIPEDRRVPESDFWARFDALRPTLLGALLDRVAGGLRALPGVTLDRLPRMADFARWGVACERGAGEPERFLAAYTANQSGAHEQALDGSSLAAAVVALLSGCGEWAGTSTDLLKALTPHAPDPLPRDWPKAANALAGRLRRLAPNLRRVHRIDFDTDRAPDATRRRVVRLRRLPDGPSEPSAPPGRGVWPTESHPPADDVALPADRPGRRPDRPTPDPSPATTGRPDGRGRSPVGGPSDDVPSETGGSDGPDGSDDPDPPVEVVSRTEYQRFLDLH